MEQRISSKITLKSKDDEQSEGWGVWGKELPLSPRGSFSSENFPESLKLFKVLIELKKGTKIRNISAAAQPGNFTIKCLVL